MWTIHVFGILIFLSESSILPRRIRVERPWQENKIALQRGYHFILSTIRDIRATTSLFDSPLGGEKSGLFFIWLRISGVRIVLIGWPVHTHWSTSKRSGVRTRGWWFHHIYDDTMFIVEMVRTLGEDTIYVLATLVLILQIKYRASWCACVYHWRVRGDSRLLQQTTEEFSFATLWACRMKYALVSM